VKKQFKEYSRCLISFRASGETHLNRIAGCDIPLSTSHHSDRGAISQAKGELVIIAQQIQWGITTLILDNEAFRRGFLAARRWYYEGTYGEDGRHPEEPQRAQSLTSEEVLRLIVMSDEQGRYHFDEMGSENLPNTWGIWSAT